ncbi:MAG TPA: hypothetical protein VGF02_14760 [Pseudolabrys sp.]
MTPKTIPSTVIRARIIVAIFDPASRSIPIPHPRQDGARSFGRKKAGAAWPRRMALFREILFNVAIKRGVIAQAAVGGGEGGALAGGEGAGVLAFTWGWQLDRLAEHRRG